MTTIMTQAIARLLLLPTLMIAVAVLIKGYSSVGDGFTAAVIAALGVLLQYVALGVREVEDRLPVRFAPRLAWAGLLLGLLVAYGPVLWGASPVTHYPLPGQSVVQLGTLELHTALLFDLGVFATVLGVAVTVMHELASLAEEAKA